eukprot:CFRG3091T1
MSDCEVDMDKARTVIVGFVDEYDSTQSDRDPFPSKVGGKPEWLCQPHIPDAKDLECPECSTPMVFLLQLYAPFDDKPDEAYHRTVYIFYCREKSCQQKQLDAQILVRKDLISQEKSNNAIHDNDKSAKAKAIMNTMRAVRFQLPKENKFYSVEGERKQSESTTSITTPKLCVVCGARGSKTCGSCHNVTYCSRAHQILHWKHYKHNSSCVGKPANSGIKPVQSPLDEQIIAKTLLRELELYSDEVERASDEDEDSDSDSDDDGEGSSSCGKKPKDKEESRMNDYLMMVAEINAKRAREGIDPLEKEEMPFDDAKVKTDKVFLKFQREIKATGQNQVLRYVLENHANAVWVNSETIPPSEIRMIDRRQKLSSTVVPKCEQCGAVRVLEFQILPQLLYHMNLDDEWGVLSVYTCSESCTPKVVGKSCLEYVYRQDIGSKATYELPMSDVTIGKAKGKDERSNQLLEVNTQK